MKKLKSLYYQCRVQGIDYRLMCCLENIQAEQLMVTQMLVCFG